MRSMKKYLLLSVTVMALGCSQNHDTATVSEMRLQNPAPSQDVPPAPQMPLQKVPSREGSENPEETIEKKLIKEGIVEFRTSDEQKTRSAITGTIAQYNGYISSESGSNYSDRISNTIIIRVPAQNFDSLLAGVTKGIKRFDTKEITLKDVTEEYLDIQARLKTKRELELRYRDLLKRANSVSDVLEIEKQSGELRSDIEAIEGRLRYLQSQVSYSTLTVTFYQIVPAQTSFKENFKTGFKNGWDNLIYFFIGLANLWPFILIGTGIITGFRFYRKKKRQKEESI